MKYKGHDMYFSRYKLDKYGRKNSSGTFYIDDYSFAILKKGKPIRNGKIRDAVFIGDEKIVNIMKQKVDDIISKKR